MTRTRSRLLALGTTLAAATALLLPFGAPAQARVAAPAAPLAPVASLDLARYTGTWEQVAAIPQLFQAQCARDSRADYTAVDADTIGVRNTCRTWLGTTSGVTGTADVLDRTTWAQVRRIVEARGYDSCRFLVTPVAGGRQDRTPLCLVR